LIWRVNAGKNVLNIYSDAKKILKKMNLNQVDIGKLPADVRKTFKQLRVLHA